MFDFVRKHTKVMMSLMFLLIIPAFVLVGVDGFRRIGGTGATVAKIGSHSITESEWDAAHKQNVDRLRASNPNVDGKRLDSPEARYASLERLVRDRVLSDAANDAHFNTTDARLARELQEDRIISSLKKPDGTFDIERYRQLAASQGFTPEGFERRVRNDLILRQVEAGIAPTAFMPVALSDVAFNAYFERREVQISRFNASDYASKVSLTDAEVDAFYQSNQTLFQVPESADVEYVVLDMDAVKKTITLNEADLKTYYEQNAMRLSGKEERKASHILINAPKDMAEADRTKARERAETLLAQVRKSPESFADVARKNSQDTGSAVNGGDLGFFSRGAMVKPFEEAVFTLKKGEISNVVVSDFGFHIILLTDIKAPRQRSFEELRPSIEADLKSQQAQGKFAEAAEAFTNGVYEQSDSLKPVAERMKLEIKTATKLGRQPTPGATGVLANPKLLSALFSPESIDKKRNTEAIEVAVNQLAAARITQYTPASTQPLAEVRSKVRTMLIANRSAELAKKEGQEKLAAWKQTPPENAPPPLTLSRDASQNVPGTILEAALHADTSKLPAWAGVDLGTNGYAVVRINKVLPRNPAPPKAVEQERKQYVQWMADAEAQAYYQLLNERFKVQIKVPRPKPSALDSLAAALD
ncbi:MAG: SurA N-terminal domain-containing protein [Rhodoferax sp.]|nr:SurA N-terminal domain-containing protein [Rhodoferax sp.]